MKKAILLVFFLASTGFGQFHDDHKWFDHFVREAANNRTTPQGDTVKVGFPATSDTTWSILGTGADTSRIYKTTDNLWLGALWTSSGDDSVHLKIKWFLAPTTQYAPGKIPGFGRFVLIDSLVITRDGMQESMKKINLYTSAVPPWSWIYFTVTGLADNSKVGAVSGLMILSHWDSAALRP